ncbi:LuxR C-terminal-related transcriptional regulator [Streptomyces turgidiscabies]|uniref:Transcriptional regulator, LuxR family n=1 Tax=Streptomyces turgidiscabies (strain Car8) TaxID=698760 RepID=L7F0E3_STRT8|nr:MULTISPECIES: LuxR C-terminal-related transcriptional regulator [Streptomyces]ELP64589.1 transcriptional regulator, LuxR family [Streptomyces turgidiscabies Car8]MDX3491514.1 LuxR C-terminal-related transcriptional regulator [Streptomyces turgidiscabies]GAQ73786.1 CsgBAC operon transcriptional regulatory [Streptomyces turgidiscabies]
MTVLTAARAARFTTLLHDMRRITGVDAVMGALVAADSDHFVIDQLVGVTTEGLHNLRVAIGTGLGGKAMALHRPMQVPDYCRSGGISHEYDPAVRREQLRAAFAVPIRVPVPGGHRGVLYGARRHEYVFGDRVFGDVMVLVRALERELAEDLELNRRLECLRVAAGGSISAPNTEMSVAERRRLVDVCSELVHIASEMPDVSQRRQIEALVRRLAGRTAELPEAAKATSRALTEREREILAKVATGATNREVAAALGISAETVKSSLTSSMRKLGARNRVALVAAARARGCLR